MPESRAFDIVCEALEELVDLSRLQARGTMRLTLKHAGFDPNNVSVAELRIVVERVLPGKLESLNLDPGICAGLVARLQGVSDGEATGADDRPEAVFARFGV